MINLNSIFSDYNLCKKVNPLKVKTIESAFTPLIATSKGRELIMGYEECLADSYGIGYLFGDALYRIHLSDAKKNSKKNKKHLFSLRLLVFFFLLKNNLKNINIVL